MRKFAPILLAPILLLAASATRCGGLTERDIYTVLEDRSIPFDGVAAQRGAVEGMLKAIDPRARILTSDEGGKTSKKTMLDKAEEWPEGICYLRLNGLYSEGVTGVVGRVESWLAAGRTGLILDLRGSGGDSLRAVDEVASLFVGDGAELYSILGGHHRLAEKHFSRSTGSPVASGIPLMLAVDGDTRDASEILAAALKHRSHVILIGARTGGDTALREIIRLSPTESLYVATRWMIPVGAVAAMTNGVEPDLTVTQYTRTAVPDKAPFGRQFSEKSKRDKELMERVLGDAVLGSATDILLGLKALGIHATTTNTPSADRK